MADRLMITEVDLEIPEADAYFPDFETAEWRVAYEQELRQTAPVCVLREYLRRPT